MFGTILGGGGGGMWWLVINCNLIMMVIMSRKILRMTQRTGLITLARLMAAVVTLIGRAGCRLWRIPDVAS